MMKCQVIHSNQSPLNEFRTSKRLHTKRDTKTKSWTKRDRSRKHSSNTKAAPTYRFFNKISLVQNLRNTHCFKWPLWTYFNSERINKGDLWTYQGHVKSTEWQNNFMEGNYRAEAKMEKIDNFLFRVCSQILWKRQVQNQDIINTLKLWCMARKPDQMSRYVLNPWTVARQRFTMSGEAIHKFYDGGKRRNKTKQTAQKYSIKPTKTYNATRGKGHLDFGAASRLLPGKGAMSAQLCTNPTKVPKTETRHTTSSSNLHKQCGVASQNYAMPCVMITGISRTSLMDHDPARWNPTCLAWLPKVTSLRTMNLDRKYSIAQA